MKILLPKNKKELKKHLNDPLFKNSYFLMSASVVGSLLGFIFWMLATRYYTPHDVGLATATISAAGLLTSFSMLGFGIGIIRFLPNEKDKQGMINSCLMIIFLFSILLSFIFILGLDIWSPTLSFIRKNTIILLSFLVLVFTTSLIRFQQSVFVALRSANFTFIQNIILAVLKIVLVVCFINFGPLGIISSWGAASCVILIFGAVFLIPRKVHEYSPMPMIKRRIIKDIFHFSFLNHIVELFASIQGLILQPMIVNILMPERAAYFFMAFSIMGMLLTVSTSVSSSLFVEGSYTPEIFRNNIIKSIKFTSLILIPMIIGIFFFGDKILLLFGTEYSENSFDVLCVLALASIPIAINDMFKTTKKVQMQIEPIIYLNALMAILTIGLGYVFIRLFDILGAGIAYTLSQGIGAFIAIWITMKNRD